MDQARALRQSVARYAGARTKRDRAIREAHAAGMSFRAIAGVVGLSHQRVAQIVRADNS